MNCSSHLRQSLKIRLTLFTPVTFLIKRPVPIQQFEALVNGTFLDALGGSLRTRKAKLMRESNCQPRQSRPTSLCGRADRRGY